MMRKISLFICLLLLLSLPSRITLAQESTFGELGVYVQLVSFKVKPEHSARWENAVARIAQSAKTSRLKYDWLMYREGDFRYRMILFSDGLADITTFDSFVKAFAGTAGEKLFTQALADMKSTEFEVLENSIIQQVYAWGTVRRMSAETHPLARVVVYWIKPGKEKEYDSLIKEYVSLLKKIEYPYPFEGFQFSLFSTGKYQMATFPDSWSKFHGENRLETIAQKKGASKQLSDIQKRLSEILIRSSQFDLEYMPDLSKE